MPESPPCEFRCEVFSPNLCRLASENSQRRAKIWLKLFLRSAKLIGVPGSRLYLGGDPTRNRITELGSEPLRRITQPSWRESWIKLFNMAYKVF
jgi:hypothetical protein